MSDSKVWLIVESAFSSNQLFYTLFLTVLSFTLIGPGEEFALGSAFHSSDESEKHAEPPSHIVQYFQNLSLGAVGRFSLVTLAWLALNVVHKCMDETFSEGNIQTSIEFIFACIPTGIVTYYWCAALQRGIPNVAQSAFRAVTTALGVLMWSYWAFAIAYITLNVFTMYAAAHVGASGGGESIPGYLGVWLLFFAFWLAVAISFIFAGLSYGVFAYLGGLILEADLSRPGRPSILTIVRLVPLIAIWNAPLLQCAFVFADHLNIKEWHWDYTEFYSLFGIVGWGFGLAVSPKSSNTLARRHCKSLPKQALSCAKLCPVLGLSQGARELSCCLETAASSPPYPDDRSVVALFLRFAIWADLSCRRQAFGASSLQNLGDTFPPSVGWENCVESCVAGFRNLDRSY
jgi:hypothetical protein